MAARCTASGLGLDVDDVRRDLFVGWAYRTVQLDFDEPATWGKVEAIAAALLDRETLTGPELAELLGKA